MNDSIIGTLQFANNQIVLTENYFDKKINAGTSEIRSNKNKIFLL